MEVHASPLVLTGTVNQSAGPTDEAVDCGQDFFNDAEHWIDVRHLFRLTADLVARGGTGVDVTINGKITEDGTVVDLYSKADPTAVGFFLGGPTSGGGEGAGVDITGVAFIQVKLEPGATGETSTVALYGV